MRTAERADADVRELRPRVVGGGEGVEHGARGRRVEVQKVVDAVVRLRTREEIVVRVLLGVGGELLVVADRALGELAEQRDVQRVRRWEVAVDDRGVNLA